VVYTITGSGRDFYSAMTRVSAASIRITNPHIRVSVACDRRSATSMLANRDPLIDEVDEWLPFDTPDGDDGFRNRFVKTNLRSLIQGPFLSLDSDTLVRSDLSDLFSLDTDIACAPNHSKDLIEQQIWDKDTATLSRMQWNVRSDAYVNGGVIFYNDTTGSHYFAKDWHKKWLTSYNLAKNYRDQPALNAAIFETTPRLTLLPHRYNAQMVPSPGLVEDASIWHFYSTFVRTPTTKFELVVDGLLRGAELKRSEIETAIQSRYPWRRDFWIDDLAARLVVKKGRLDPDDYIWFEGHRARSVANRVTRQLPRFLFNSRF
jgi:hypothetical protein